MTAARLRPVTTLTPRLLDATEAALYTGRSRNTFLRGVEAGEWPKHVPDPRDVKLWDVRDLDAEIERRKGRSSIAADRAALDREMGL